ncbi:MAC/perforin domain-containing protein [Coleofasciculus sp.]|uniref:MAC/perforin domain-containing protein n=1 Tax=Coleofasciculus sp. TaxID=3100458 RepID=UPI003A20926D
MTELLPGSSSLGQGFDVFGAYDSSSLKAPLFNFTDFNDGTAVTKIGTFIKPWNTHYNPDTPSGQGHTYVFSSRQEYQEHFDLKAKLNAKIGFFRGGFDGAFNIDSNSENNYNYGLFEFEVRFWNLSVKNPVWEKLSSNVLEDPVFNDLWDINEIPKKYTPENAYIFFRFFHKYGCHYVKWVSVGAKLYYLVQVKKSYSEDKADLQAKIELEYKTVFNSAKGKVSGGWNQLGKEWAENRETHIQVVGGKDDLVAKLSGITPVFGEADNYKETFDQWIASLADNPAVIDYQLSPIEELFSGDQADQIHLAAEAYLDSQLIVSSEGGSETIRLNGIPLRANIEGSDVEESYGIIHVVIVDCRTLQTVVNQSYLIKLWKSHNTEYDTIYADVSKYEGNKNYVVAIGFTGKNTGQGFPSNRFPSQRLYQFLQSCGANVELLNTWRDKYHFNTGLAYDTISFAFIGICGSAPNSAIMRLAHGRYSNYSLYDPIKLPRVEARALLQPVGIGDGKILFRPQEI